MGCCACCLSEDQKVATVLQKFPMTSIGRCEPNPMPQLCCGRVAPVPQPLISPIGGKQCVYYTVTAKEWVERTDSEGHRHGSWEYRFHETRTIDFYLQDGDRFLFISNSTPVRRCDVEDAAADSGAGAASFFQHEQLPPRLQELLDRHHFKVEYDVLVGVAKKRMNYQESCFEINEQLGVFGIIGDGGVTPYGNPCKTVTPAGLQCLTEDYFKQNKWSGFEKEAWRLLVKDSPAVLLTDNPALMKGINIPHVIEQRRSFLLGSGLVQPISPAPMPMLPPNMQPQYAQPQYAQPQYAQPQYAQPQYAQPQYAQPQMAYAPAPGMPPPGQQVIYQQQQPQVVAYGQPGMAPGYAQPLVAGQPLMQPQQGAPYGSYPPSVQPAYPMTVPQ